jgi:pentatricopeptide repeat protein
VALLKECAKKKDLRKGTVLHAEIVKESLLESTKNPSLANTLISMYAKCGMLEKAQEVLEALPFRNVVSWSSLMAGYAQEGYGHMAMNCFERMRNEGIDPDAFAFSSALKACGSTGDVDKGKGIHEEIAGRGLLEKDIVLGTALVDMYAKCGSLAKAEQVLEELPRRDVVTWCALLSGFADHGESNRALRLFDKMQSEGFTPNAVTLICILKACGSARNLRKGEQIHEFIASKRLLLLEKDLVLANALIDMYTKCGALGKARRVFEKLRVRNVVSWSTLIAGYAERGRSDESLHCFERMKHDGFLPNVVTFIHVLQACGHSGAVEKGEEIHDEIVARGLLQKDILLGTAVVHMYAKCGSYAKARQVVEELQFRDVVAWSTLIAAYAQRGQGQEALECFGRMLSEGLPPDDVALLSVLTACNRSGRFDEAQTLLQNMNHKYGIAPSLEHQTCMVLGLGSAGHFDEAFSVIRIMPSCEHVGIWLAVLSWCKKCANAKLGKLAFDQVMQLDPSCASAYVLVAEIFTASGMQQDASKTEAMRRKYARSDDGARRK